MRGSSTLLTFGPGNGAGASPAGVHGEPPSHKSHLEEEALEEEESEGQPLLNSKYYFFSLSDTKYLVTFISI